MNGTVKFFNAAKGFGFITADDTGKDVFVPASSITAAGIAGLKQGQRVAFETVQDVKGPKAVKVALVAEAEGPAPVREAARPQPARDGKMRVTIYHHADAEGSEQVLDTIRASGFEPRIVDYTATPPTRDELRKLSILLRDRHQSLVRRYDPLFQELRLDDRFISENEFWDAILEHPSLLNGPVLATETRADICRDDDAVDLFLAGPSSDRAQAAPKKKTIPMSLLKLLKGGAPSASAREEQDTAEVETPPAQDVTAKAETTDVAQPVETDATPNNTDESKKKPGKGTAKLSAPAKAKPPKKKADPKPVKKAVKKVSRRT